MPARRKKPLARGFVNKKILESLLDGDKYGYEIIKEVKEKSDGKIELKQPSLYSSLKRFEQKGLISSYWGDSDIGGRRHYYSITEVGKNYYYAENSSSIDDLEDVPSTAIEEEESEQITLTSSTLEFSDVYDEVHGGFEIDKASDDEEDNLLYDVHKEEISGQNKYLTDDILEQMKKQYSVAEEDVEQASDITINGQVTIESVPQSPSPIDFNSVEHVDQHIQQDLFDTLPTQSISNDVLTPNFEQMKEIKANDESPIMTQQEKSKHDIPLIEEKPISYHDWEDMKKQATNKKSFDDDQEETFKVSESIKKQYNTKVFLDESERIDVSDNINVSLNQNKSNELRFVLDNAKTDQSSYITDSSKDVDYKSILSELYQASENSPTKESQPYEEMVSKELSTTQTIEEHTLDIEEPKIEQSTEKYYFDSNKEILKDIKIKYYEPALKEVADNNFVKINKVNSIATGIMCPIICLQALIVLLIQLVNPTMLVGGKLPIASVVFYIIAFAGSVLLAVSYVFAYLINPTKKVKRTYLTKNFVWNGMIALFASLLLILTINMLCGCRANNWVNFYAPILIPSILSTNFVIFPLIKGFVMRKVK